ncbi:MAG: hypothetical protein RBU37_13420, partial [Myxococcota bacterium]|nr:hypothetical protein [Myxococcota bacterium]
MPSEGPGDEQPPWPEWVEYRGEVKARRYWLGAVMTLLAPGLGYVYYGRFVFGLLVNGLFLLSSSVLVLSWAFTKFFPPAPFLVYAVSWLLMLGLILFDLRGLHRREREYVLRPGNHVLVYLLVLVATFWVPLSMTVNWSFAHVWQRTWAGNDAMFPTVAQGDLVMIDRSAYLHRPPQRSELVLVE